MLKNLSFLFRFSFALSWPIKTLSTRIKIDSNALVGESNEIYNW